MLIEVADQKIAIQQDEDAIRAAIKKSDDEKDMILIVSDLSRNDKPDMIVTWKVLENGLIWKANVELAMEDVGESSFYSVDVYVVAPNQRSCSIHCDYNVSRV